jgi:hypothetical protein
MLPPIAADPGSSPPTIVVDDSRNEPATKPRRSTIKRAASEISDLKSENEAPAAPAPKRRGRPPKAKPAASIPKPDQDIQEEKDEKPAAKKATTVPKKKSNNAKKDSTPTPEPTRRSARTRRATSKVAESATLTKPAGILKSKNNAASTGKKSVVFDAGVKAGSEAPSEGTLVEEEEEEEIAQLLARGPKEIRKGISKEIRRVKKGDADRAKAVANEIVAEAQMIRDAVNRNQANGGVRESEPVGPLNHLAPPFAKFWETEDNAESAAAKEVEEKKDVADGNLYFGYGVELSVFLSHSSSNFLS